MIIQIEIRDRWIHSLKNKLINFIKYIYGWISKDDEFLGHVLATGHFIIAATLYLLLIACHVIYPSWKFQLFVYLCILAVWLQHVILKVCISVVAEKELTKSHVPSIQLFEFVLHKLNLTFEHFTNYVLTAETICIGMFTLELASKLILYFYETGYDFSKALNII